MPEVAWCGACITSIVMADILIVEDDADLAATVAELCAIDGHTTRTTFNGQEGLLAMDDHLPDLIVLDIEMPVLDGVGMAYAALAKDAGRELIPIVISSGYGDVAAIARELGTEYWVVKPCSLDTLRKVIALALTEHHPPQPSAEAFQHCSP